MSAASVVRDYYEALERGEPLSPFFAKREDVVKYGIRERLVGDDEIAEGLLEQTNTTADWHVDSRSLRVSGGNEWAYFTDLVRLSWRRLPEDDRVRFDSRWSGCLERIDGEWLFVGMHVSAPTDIERGVSDGRTRNGLERAD